MTTDSLAPRSTIDIDEAKFNHIDGEQTIWRGNHDLALPESGEEEGLLMVALDVDGMFDIVYADLGISGDLASLDRAISAMQRVRDGLSELYGGRNRPGCCFEQGAWGRCHAEEGHDGAHKFPTEEEGRKMASLSARMAS